MQPHVIIEGSVINSQILVAGRDIVVGPPASLTKPPDGRVLLPFLDWEVRSVSSDSRAMTPAFSDALSIARLELRALLLAIPPEGSLVVPPSYYCESALSRSILEDHIEAIEQGTIKLITDDASMDDYMEAKRARYQKARHFRRYNDAYFQPTYSDIGCMPFQASAKAYSVGRLGLDLWSNGLREGVVDAPAEIISEIQRRTFETEKPSFLWENVSEHLVGAGLAPNSKSGKAVRQLKNRAYLSAYEQNGISVPSHSAFMSEAIVPLGVNRGYSIRSWLSLFSILDLTSHVAELSVDQLTKIRRRPEVAAALAVARSSFSAGQFSDEAVAELLRQNLLEPLQAGLRKR